MYIAMLLPFENQHVQSQVWWFCSLPSKETTGEIPASLSMGLWGKLAVSCGCMGLESWGTRSVRLRTTALRSVGYDGSDGSENKKRENYLD